MGRSLTRQMKDPASGGVDAVLTVERLVEISEEDQCDRVFRDF